MAQLGSLLTVFQGWYEVVRWAMSVSWRWTHSQAHSGSELSSVSFSPGTEATFSLQTVDQGLVLAARVLAAFLHVLSALPVSLRLHPRQQRMTSLLYFRFI